jgi:hypothetical protein
MHTNHASIDKNLIIIIFRKRRIGTDRDTVPMGNFFGELNTARPTVEDMIIAYSTIPGFTSLRDHEKGTWF